MLKKSKLARIAQIIENRKSDLVVVHHINPKTGDVNSHLLTEDEGKKHVELPRYKNQYTYSFSLCDYPALSTEQIFSITRPLLVHSGLIGTNADLRAMLAAELAKRLSNADDRARPVSKRIEVKKIR